MKGNLNLSSFHHYPRTAPPAPDPTPRHYSGSFLPVTAASLTGCLELRALEPPLFIPIHSSALWPVAGSLAFLWLSFPIHKTMITILTPLGCCKGCEYSTLGKAHSTSLTQRKYTGIYSSRVPHFLLMLPPENLPHLFPLQFLLNPINLIPFVFSTLLWIIYLFSIIYAFTLASQVRDKGPWGRNNIIPGSPTDVLYHLALNFFRIEFLSLEYVANMWHVCQHFPTP